MTRAQLEHLLRAAGDLCQEDEFIVIGFARAAIAHGLADEATLLDRLALTAVPAVQRAEIAARVGAYFRAT